MRLCGTVYVISALVVLVAQLVEIPSINASKSAGFCDSSIFTTLTSYIVYSILVVCLFRLSVVWTRVFLSFVATLDDHDFQPITILNTRLADAFSDLAALFKWLWRRFWLILIVFVTIGVFWPWSTQVLRAVCDCSAAAHPSRAASLQASIVQLRCDTGRSSFPKVHLRPTYFILVSVARLISLGAVGTVPTAVILELVALTYAAVIIHIVLGVHVPCKAIPSVGRHVSVIRPSSGPQSPNFELLPEISVCRLPIPIISAHELSSRFPQDYLIHPDFITKYELGADLGKGGNGFVLQAQRRTDHKAVAVKFARKPNTYANFWNQHPQYGFVNGDVAVMDRARHDNIITLLDVFSDDRYLYIVQELFGTLSFVSAAEEDEYWIKKWPNGSRCLESYVQINGPMSLQDSKYVFYQLVDAVAHLHSLGISHCDIKPENILIDSTTLKIKLIDFGNSTWLSEKYDPSKGKAYYAGIYASHFCGTKAYTPPEIHNCELFSTDLADVWAMGLVLCFMLIGHLPYGDLEFVKAGQLGCHDACHRVLDPVAFIVWSCLKTEILLRPTAAELQLGDDYLPLSLERNNLVGMSTDELWKMKYVV